MFSLTDGVRCAGAGLAPSEGKEDDNDNDFDDDDSDGGPRPGAIGQNNVVSVTSRSFVEKTLIFNFYLGVPHVFVILKVRDFFFACMYVYLCNCS